MFPKVLVNLFRCVVKLSPPAPPAVRPLLKAWLHADIPDSGSDHDNDDSPVAVEREKRNMLETLTTAIPQLAGVHRGVDGSIRLPLPRGLDADTLIWKLKRTQAFKWDRAGETVVKDELYAHNMRHKATLSSAWKTKPQVLQSRVARNNAKTMKKASEWLESFINGTDADLLPRIRSCMDPDAIWEQLAFIVDAALMGQDSNPQDDVASPALEKVDPLPDPTLHFMLGVLEVSGDSCLKIYSLRLTGWAEYDAQMGHLRSGVKGVLKCVRYEPPSH